MPMVCPQCQESFDQRLACPQCGVRLAYATERGGRTIRTARSGLWVHNPWSRVLVGLLLAQGIYRGLRQLCMAGLLAAGEGTPHTLWGSVQGLLLLQGMQGLGILVGAALAGAGQPRGLVYGSIVGLGNSLLSLLLVPPSALALTPVTLYGQPIVHTVLGLLGGGLGCAIWRPLKPVALQLPHAKSKAAAPGHTQLSLFRGHIAWGRVLVGTAIGVCGTFWAHALLDLMLDAAEGKLTIDSSLEMQLVTWEITALSLLTGSAVAGAGTSNSLKQGLCVGLASGLLLIGLRLRTQPERLQMLLVIAASTLTLGMAGSWFGGQLFPPVLPAPRRKRRNSFGY
jgi:hypothetical protein